MLDSILSVILIYLVPISLVTLMQPTLNKFTKKASPSKTVIVLSIAFFVVLLLSYVIVSYIPTFED